MNVWIKMPGFRLLLLLLLLPAFLLAQSRKELEEKRKKIIRDITSTERMIKKTAQSREATYDKYVALQSQIQNRETLIRTIQEEVEAAEENIERNQNVIASLEQDIQQMQAEYGKMVRNAYRRKSLSNPLLYIYPPKASIRPFVAGFSCANTTASANNRQTPLRLPAKCSPRKSDPSTKPGSKRKTCSALFKTRKRRFPATWSRKTKRLNFWQKTKNG